MDWRPTITAALAATTFSASQLPVLEKHEGKKLQAYPDPAYGWNMPTICVGHTRDVKRGDVATDAQCQEWLREDIAEAVGFLTWSLPGVYLTQGEVNSYGSLVFNLKRNSWLTSTARKELLNPKGDRYAACLYAMRFNRADNKVYRGLTDRRYDEYNQCISYLPAPYLWEYNHVRQNSGGPARPSASRWWRADAQAQGGR